MSNHFLKFTSYFMPGPRLGMRQWHVNHAPSPITSSTCPVLHSLESQRESSTLLVESAWFGPVKVMDAFNVSPGSRGCAGSHLVCLVLFLPAGTPELEAIIPFQVRNHFMWLANGSQTHIFPHFSRTLPPIHTRASLN